MLILGTTNRHTTMKTVLIICGTGVATSTVVAMKVKDHCAEVGIPVTVRQAKVADILNDPPDADLIVATTQVPASIEIPVVAGMPFLTGVGIDEALATIEEHLR